MWKFLGIFMLVLVLAPAIYFAEPGVRQTILMGLLALAVEAWIVIAVSLILIPRRK